MATTKEIMGYSDLETPCFIFDIDEFDRGVNLFKQALSKYFNRTEIGYSVKTNSLPYTLCRARELGCMAEVVSHDEYNLAKLCGFTSERIIYNGPMKSKETFIEAIDGGAIVNIETKRELKWLDELPAHKMHKVGLRLNINISNISPEDADGDDDNSRFGFSEQSGEFIDAIRHIETIPFVKLSGLHIHRTAHSRSPRFYQRSVEYAARVINKYHLDLDYIDIGGGYFGIFPGKPTFDDYAEAINKSLTNNSLNHLRVIIEPGNALTASAFKFLAEVIDVKRIDEHTVFATTDGSRNDIDPFFHKKDYLREILLTQNEPRPIEPTQTVTGCTCLEYDRLFTLHNHPQLIVGDRILFNNVGAYTMTLSPLFIRLLPAVYSIADNRFQMIRQPWNAMNLIQQNKISKNE